MKRTSTILQLGKPLSERHQDSVLLISGSRYPGCYCALDPLTCVNALRNNVQGEQLNAEPVYSSQL